MESDYMFKDTLRLGLPRQRQQGRHERMLPPAQPTTSNRKYTRAHGVSAPYLMCRRQPLLNAASDK